jgi:hypothetical protein
VFLAEQVDTGRPVALKRILVQDDEHMEIIKREINFLVRPRPSLSSLACVSVVDAHQRARTTPLRCAAL